MFYGKDVLDFTGNRERLMRATLKLAHSRAMNLNTSLPVPQKANQPTESVQEPTDTQFANFMQILIILLLKG